MIKIGILGDIGAGKSFISNLFGYPVFNADAEVRKIYKKNYKCFLKLKYEFPNFITKFPVLKEEILNLIENKNLNIIKIGKIVHPYVRKNLKLFLMKNRNKKIVILDIPLLLENKLNSNDMILIFIETKKKDVLKRLKKRQYFNFKLHKTIKNNQLALSIKRKKSDFIIKNNFKIQYVKNNIKKIKKDLKNYD